MTEIDRLQKTIFDLHGCDSKHIAPIYVREIYEGKTAWEGAVELFLLLYHQRAKEAFAWSYKADDQRTRYVAVLAVPPIVTATDAVRAYFALRTRNQR
jgi:hypothetical protein